MLILLSSIFILAATKITTLMSNTILKVIIFNCRKVNTGWPLEYTYYRLYIPRDVLMLGATLLTSTLILQRVIPLDPPKNECNCV